MTAHQLALTLPATVDKFLLLWQGYTPDTPDEEARNLFTARHGHQPQRIKRNAGAVLAGPMREEK